MKRVLLTFPGCHRRGGVERVVWEFGRHLSLRYDVTIVANDFEPGFDATRIPVSLSSPVAALQPALFARRAAKLVRSTAPDVTVSFGVQGPLLGVAWVQSVHRAWLDQPPPPNGGPHTWPVRRLLPRHQVLLALERRYFTRGQFGRVIATSQRVADDLARLYGVPDDLMTVIPNGFSPTEFSIERRRSLREAERRRLGFGAHEVILLLVANELARKGFPVLVRALERLKRHPVRLVVCGRADPFAGAQGRAVATLRDRITYLGLSLDVGRTHAAADLVVLPTRYEPFGLAAVEGLASGLPLIVSSVAGVADAVIPGTNGLLLEDPDDDAELASHVVRLLDPTLREAMSVAAADSVDQYAWPVVLPRAEAVLAGVAAGA